MSFCSQCGRPTSSGVSLCAICSDLITPVGSGRSRWVKHWGAVLTGSLIVVFLLTVAFGVGIWTERRNSDSSQSMEPPAPTTTNQFADTDTDPPGSASGKVVPPVSPGISSIPSDTPTTTTTTTSLPPTLLPTLWAVASGTAPAAMGDDGSVVPYGAMNTIDGSSGTIWRVPGDGVGQRVHVRLAEPAEIVRIGLLPGDNATHVVTGADPHAQDPEIRVVRWIFEDGTEVVQDLSSGAQFQYVEIPEVVSTMVVVEILATADPDGVDYAAISEIEIYGRQPEGELFTAETTTYAHVFPLDPPNAGSYSPGGHGYPATDIFAFEDTPFVAVTSGLVDVVSAEDVWDPAVNDGATRGGLYVGFIGDDGIRYYGSHLSSVVDGIAPGIRVAPGQLLGFVGRSGNARETTPHLHFGISTPTYPGDWQTRRGQIDPVPFLDAWRSGDESATPNLDDIG